MLCFPSEMWVIAFKLVIILVIPLAHKARFSSLVMQPLKRLFLKLTPFLCLD